MKAKLYKLVGQFCIVILLLLFPEILQAGLGVKNSSAYLGGGRWNWTIFIDADDSTMARIKCVNYRLHPTFARQLVPVCDSPETAFRFSANGWGTFTVGVEVVFKDGGTKQLQHLLTFAAADKDESLNVRPENWSNQIEPGWWEWGIYMAGSAADLQKVRCVEYTLHPSFPNPVRVVCSPQDRFELVTRGWGTFEVQIKLILQDGSVRKLSHQLRLQ